MLLFELMDCIIKNVMLLISFKFTHQPIRLHEQSKSEINKLLELQNYKLEL